MNIYLDGCSMVWGAGLEPEEKLVHLIRSNHSVSIDDFSQGGKSNFTIAIDVYNNFDKYDAFIIGFTYSDRFALGVEDGQTISIGPNFTIPPKHATNNLEKIVSNFQEYFYKLYDKDYWGNYSDMLVDSTLTLLEKHNKKVFAFTWEKRKTKICSLSNIAQTGNYSRQTDRHLDAMGMKMLYNNIIKNFSEVLS